MWMENWYMIKFDGLGCMNEIILIYIYIHIELVFLYLQNYKIR